MNPELAELLRGIERREAELRSSVAAKREALAHAKGRLERAEAALALEKKRIAAEIQRQAEIELIAK